MADIPTLTPSPEVAQQSQRAEQVQPALASLVHGIERLESIIAGWEDTQQNTVQALRQSIDQLHKEAFSRLIREIKSDPAAQSGLRQAVSDEVVYAVLRHFQLIKPSLHERLEDALNSVRPGLQAHGGNVELVAVHPPDIVEIRLVGACDGCPSSNLTLTEGVEKAIKNYCPEIATINKVKETSEVSGENGVLLNFVSPFAKSGDQGWQFATNVEQILEGGMTVKEVKGHSLLMSREGQRITCFENRCAHMGMPLDMGEVKDGILTCPYHGFQYSLASGKCLTAPEVQLLPHAVRVTGTTVEVKISE